MTSTLRSLTSARPRAGRTATFLASAALLAACSSVGAHREGAPAEAPRPAPSSFGVLDAVGAASPSPAPPPPFSNGTSSFPAFLNGTPEFVESFPDPAPASPEGKSAGAGEVSPAVSPHPTDAAEVWHGPCETSFYGTAADAAHLSDYTANGGRFDPSSMTVAHRSLPFGTLIEVEHAGATVVVEVVDRGPAAWTGRCLDLTSGAWDALGVPRSLGHVDVRWREVAR